MLAGRREPRVACNKQLGERLLRCIAHSRAVLKVRQVGDVALVVRAEEDIEVVVSLLGQLPPILRQRDLARRPDLIPHSSSLVPAPPHI